jgi:hypothetical protein
MRSRDSPMSSALPGRSPTGPPDRRRLRIGHYRVMYDITAETVSVWHLGRGWAGS